MSVAVGLGIVLETPQTGDDAAAKAATTHAAHETQAGDGTAHKAGSKHAANDSRAARGG